MNPVWKRTLTEAFAAPPPVRKTAFLKKHCRRELGRREILTIQIRYIPWWVWGASLALFLGILLTGAQKAAPTPWAVSALTPFLALLVITENGRSQLCGMEELELACRFSRHSAIMARMTAQGLFHLLLFAALTPALAVWGAIGIVRAGVYLLTPYLLTSSAGMELTRRFRGRASLRACAGAAAIISGLGIAVPRYTVLYQPDESPLWGAVLAASFLVFAAECALYIRKMREPQWN